MVTRLVQKKRRRQFVLKKRANVKDASNKGEKEAQTEKESTAERAFEVEGEEEFAETVETVNAAKAAETVNTAKAAVTEAAVTGLSVEELEIAETLVKAKNDTPKATQKGKAKMVESEQPLKKNQVELDEAVAKQLQVEMEKEELLQSEKDRELELNMARKLNEEYQKSMKTAAQAKKVQVKRMPLKKQKRQPSKTFLANQERRKMINFLKGAIGFKGEMFNNMAYTQIEELYQKEMAKLQGDSAQREEAERRMKERYDLNIQKPFPEETTPSKDKTEEMKEEHEGVGVEATSGKRVKTIAAKKQNKRPRVEETAEITEPSVTSTTESVKNPEQSNKQYDLDLYMTTTADEPVSDDPISMKALEVIFWDILEDQTKK
ncbi:hypothetical protein L6452_34736 [Arctium lappa]|uniref:Uncharacterized protein n=1 Tax=Arctium lappa TaxID=4217 RepID=A0ACB8YJJ7_ARCLA|nr:hypothetical protein L6452_34736 [Arctium lappa]